MATQRLTDAALMLERISDSLLAIGGWTGGLLTRLEPQVVNCGHAGSLVRVRGRPPSGAATAAGKGRKMNTEQMWST